MNIALTKKSSNAKVGAIPVTTSSKASCPPACPLLDNGCYASAGFHTNMHWNKVTSGERGGSVAALREGLQAYRGSKAAKQNKGLWRHNVAGDLIGQDDILDGASLRSLVAANEGLRGFTYTHYPLGLGDNEALIREANSQGFTVNVSCNSPQEALSAPSDLPRVTIVPSDYWTTGDKQGDIIRCPAETRDEVTCASCQLCQRSTRSVVVGFTVHGTKSKAADIIARA